jgi:thymidylate kinase
MPAASKSGKAVLVSFSGVDGAGKSTQIANLEAVLKSGGYRVRLLSFWDNVVVGCRWREGFVHRAYGSERGIGAPGKPVERRDKNVRHWYLTLARHALYFLDAMNLAWVTARERSDCDILIFDRYIYDELANLPLSSRLTRAYIWLVTAIVPRPDVAYLLDADPAAARERKPEYPVEFMRKCRVAYKQLAIILRTFTVIPPLELPSALRAVASAFFLNTGLPRNVQPETMPDIDVAPAA